MTTYANLNKTPGQPSRFEKPYGDILMEVPVKGALKILTAAEYITNQQIAWWKGVFLPALSEDNGESIACWETRLKLQVLPNDFMPIAIDSEGGVVFIMPSITKLGKTKMTFLIQESVQHLREHPKYDGKYQWVTLPNSAKKKLKRTK